MKWPTLRIFEKIVLRIAPRILAHAIATQTHPTPKLWQEPTSPLKFKDTIKSLVRYAYLGNLI